METPEWLNYLISSNPQGVMRVLAQHGYTGYLAPQDEQELYEASLEFIHNKGDFAVIELLKSHPLYEAFSEIITGEMSHSQYKNADGDQNSVIDTIKKIDYKKAVETTLIIIGAVYIADKLWSSLFKE